jgi:hypothetical protein
VAPTSGGPLRRLAKQALSIFGPSWAPDSKAIFASRSTGTLFNHSRDELVRIDLADGTVTQITQGGGIWPRPSADGKFLYYFSRLGSPLLRVPTEGGKEEPVIGPGEYTMWAIAIGAKYLYLFNMLHDKANPLASELVRLDPATREAVTLATIPFRPTSAHLSPDRRCLYFEQADESRRRVVLVRGL